MCFLSMLSNDRSCFAALLGTHRTRIDRSIYFALNSVFIGNNKPNGLNGTTIILTACNGTANQYVIQRFFQEGVKAYISWDGYVNLSHSDEATLRLVKAVCTEGLSPKASVEEVNKEVVPDPFYESKLICTLP